MADARAHGVNCIDSADVYSKGGSEAMVGELLKGQIRYWGVSNFRGWRIAEMMRLAGPFGMPAPLVCQPCYNLLNRMPEVEVLPACAHYGIGVTRYSPVARGVPGHSTDRPGTPGTPGAIA